MPKLFWRYLRTLHFRHMNMSLFLFVESSHFLGRYREFVTMFNQLLDLRRRVFVSRGLQILVLIVCKRVFLRSLMLLFLSFFIFQFLERSLKIESFVGLSLDKVRHNLPIFHCLNLFIDTVTVIPLLSIVNLHYLLDAVNFGRGTVDIFSSQMPMIIFLDDLLNKHFGFATSNFTNFEESPTRNRAHKIGGIYRVRIFLVMLSTTQNTVA
jgi:hypothetical protein